MSGSDCQGDTRICIAKSKFDRSSHKLYKRGRMQVERCPRSSSNEATEKDGSGVNADFQIAAEERKVKQWGRLVIELIRRGPLLCLEKDQGEQAPG